MPSDASELEVGHGNRAPGSAPRGGASVGAGEIVGVGTVRQTTSFSVVRGSAPGFEGPSGSGCVASTACRASVQENDGGERVASGFGAECVGGELSEVAECSKGRLLRLQHRRWRRDARPRRIT